VRGDRDRASPVQVGVPPAALRRLHPVEGPDGLAAAHVETAAVMRETDFLQRDGPPEIPAVRVPEAPDPAGQLRCVAERRLQAGRRREASRFARQDVLARRSARVRRLVRTGGIENVRVVFIAEATAVVERGDARDVPVAVGRDPPAPRRVVERNPVLRVAGLEGPVTSRGFAAPRRAVGSAVECAPDALPFPGGRELACVAGGNLVRYPSTARSEDGGRRFVPVQITADGVIGYSIGAQNSAAASALAFPASSPAFRSFSASLSASSLTLSLYSASV